jgi:hypothetical protein
VEKMLDMPDWREDVERQRACIEDSFLYAIKSDLFPTAMFNLFKHPNITILGSDLIVNINRIIERTSLHSVNNTSLLLSTLFCRDNTSLLHTLYTLAEQCPPSLVRAHFKFIFTACCLLDRTQRPIDLLLRGLDNYTLSSSLGDIGSYIREYSIHILLTINGCPSEIAIDRNITVDIEKYIIKYLIDRSTRLSHSLVDRFLPLSLSSSSFSLISSILSSYKENIKSFSREESLIRAVLLFIDREPVAHAEAVAGLSNRLSSADRYTHTFILSLIDSLPNKEKIQSLIKTTK